MILWGDLTKQVFREKIAGELKFKSVVFILGMSFLRMRSLLAALGDSQNVAACVAFGPLSTRRHYSNV